MEKSGEQGDIITVIVIKKNLENNKSKVQKFKLKRARSKISNDELISLVLKRPCLFVFLMILIMNVYLYVHCT